MRSTDKAKIESELSSMLSLASEVFQHDDPKSPEGSIKLRLDETKRKAKKLQV